MVRPVPASVLPAPAREALQVRPLAAAPLRPLQGQGPEPGPEPGPAAAPAALREPAAAPAALRSRHAAACRKKGKTMPAAAKPAGKHHECNGNLLHQPQHDLVS
ncbi:hypothetical protein GJA_1047 [Janthinobacterium agaricidamnosum NBRC 102515 = DSM 9628]|uniref:Uncharacterized protein n=1 Tax=Janthinobacterium agaricidamnosum NBRC 102515 = DSM 9628 TaxID=1349767 RepID=W0V350_9BURK|nr:hypothetical protein GJA_1047 [Janthinobacterium agaricidamnosum NBRC 102515 = DSM 9628]